ncbi:MAG TPA: glycosyltransferase family 39 protein [Polyangiales bacterium]|nr:glycosyltransferase family 39 protein [Polyangiales bacterium]
MQRRRVALWGLAAGSCVALLLLVRISAFGIWDPWELGTADAARKLASGQGGDEKFGASVWLVSRGFALFGIHEWAGRLPIALCGVLTALIAFALGARWLDTRGGVYAALIAGTSPLFVFNSRAMLGEAPAFGLSALLGLCALRALCPVAAPGGEPPARRSAWLWFGATLVATALTIWIQGALLGALPPLLAAVLISPLAPADSRPRAVAWASSLVLLVLTGLIARDVLRDSGDHSLWLGGHVTSGVPPTFDKVFEEIFHAFAPWSALLPLAVGQLWLRNADTESTDRRELQLGLFALAWAAAGYGTQTFFLSRYGSEVAYLPLVALALLVALFLRGVEREGQPSWALALAAVFLTGLILRDYALYPSGPVNGMPLSTFEVPAVFNPKRVWAVLLGVFALSAFFGLGVTRESAGALALAAPYRFLRAQWRRGWAFRGWLIALALVLVGLVVLGVLAYAMPDKLRMPTVALRWVKRLVFLPLVIAALVALAQLLLWLFGKLGSYRFAPLLGSGLAIGIYAAHGFLPALSEHFSPREIYTTYNALAATGEELGEYNVGGRAAAYYAKGSVIELDSMGRLLDHLTGPTRRWAAFPADELPEIDRGFRQRTHQHLFVADARSARVLLATNRPVEGRRDENFLRDLVRSAAPERIQHANPINFEKRIELLGYDLDLPHDGYVGAGESFTLRWYFRVLQAGVPGYKVFVHVDGQGQRIHGDHEPVDGKYPLRLWDPGDVIVDEQKLDVPANFRAGDYTIYMGFYSGESRLKIESGPNDGSDRATAGVLRIQ